MKFCKYQTIGIYELFFIYIFAYTKLDIMKKLALLSVLMFAASSMFAQTANPSKNPAAGANQSGAPKPKNTADLNGAGKNNPIGKNGVNTSKPVTTDKINTTKVGATSTSTPVKKN